MTDPHRLLVVLGPTGTGKTSLAVRLAAALDGEIVGCDALQLYRGFDVGTAKPTAEERAAVRHHLVDALPPDGRCTLADYVALAEQAIADIRQRGRLPLVVGGSGMYLRGLLRGLLDMPPVDPALRRRLGSMLERFGPRRLHRWLAGLDPASAGRLDPRDSQRIARALELALSGETWSDRLRREGTWASGRERYASVKIGLDMDRAALNERIERRVDVFFQRGLVGEVRTLLAGGVPPDAGGFRAIGYREVLAALDGELDERALAQRVKRNTRAYVKRQRSWYRRERDIHWLDAGEPFEALTDAALALWRGVAGASNQGHSRDPRA